MGSATIRTHPPHWSEILRVVASIRTGTVTASLIMRQLAPYPRQNGVAAALRELGRMERTPAWQSRTAPAVDARGRKGRVYGTLGGI